MLRRDGWQDRRTGPQPTGGGLKRLSSLQVIGTGTAFLVAPGYALTNRHVVEGADQFLLLTSGGEKVIGIAKVAAEPDRDDIDLALLSCPQLNGKPLRLVLGFDYAKVGSQIAVVGYPQPGVRGPDVKRTFGRVVAEPTEKLGDYYFLSVGNADLSGNSGGPVIDRNGNVIGVFTLAIRSLSFVEQLTGAVPCARAVSLFQKVGIVVTPATAQPAGDNWENMLPGIEQSVYWVICLAEPAPDDAWEPFRALLARLGWKGLEMADPWCIRCNGRGVEDCPNPSCGRGSVSRTQPRILGQDPSTQAPVVVMQPVRVTCTACNGAGRVPCSSCRGNRFLGLSRAD